ncbi:DUF4062 domain-containing protein [Corynebacterium frankenforstense]|uniref:DUF4062 domain-containing protein n=1 Tax=Corynebacterium frankenforstense TaxID=1230998 RepID=UPI0026EC1880|nr:DUF4062 domain-containing protein [Corynebacterium frankenforstense]
MSVLIASPFDVAEFRDPVEKFIHEWNGENSAATGMVLLPWRWENDSYSQWGDHPQNILNKQGLDGSDIVIAIFGSRLGSPTENSLSGTVEEIKRAIDAGKPVHLYFFKGASPNDVDVNQLDGLRKFKKRMQGRGLFGEYEDVDTLIQYVRFGGP